MSEEPKRKRKKVASNIEVLESESSMETESGHTSNNQAPSLNYEELAKAERFKNTGAVLEMDAKDFTMEYVRRSKLKQPILFTGQLKQLGMRIPKLNTRQIVQKLSDGFSCFVTNDKTHQTTTMPIKDFVYDKFNKHNRSEVLQMSTECINSFKESLNEENFCQRLILALEHGDQQFQRHVIDFTKQLGDWRDKLFNSEQWHEFIRQDKETSKMIWNRSSE